MNMSAVNTWTFESALNMYIGLLLEHLGKGGGRGQFLRVSIVAAANSSIIC